MVPFLMALIIDLAVAIIMIVPIVRLLRGHGSPALLSYLFYLILWHFMVLYLLVFLSASHILPENARRGYMLLNSIFTVPLHGLIAYFFIDFIWRWLERPVPRWLRWGLPVPFCVILVTYARDMLARLSGTTEPELFTLSAPVSQPLMFAGLLLISLYALISGRRLHDRQKGGAMQRFAAGTGGSLIVGFLLVFAAGTLLDLSWQSGVTSMIAATVNIAGWLIALRFFRSQARNTAIGLASADLSLLETRYGVTPREREIIALVITGKSNREITDELFISPETVKKHLYNAYRKLEVKNRVQLVNAVLGLSGDSD